VIESSRRPSVLFKPVVGLFINLECSKSLLAFYCGPDLRNNLGLDRSYRSDR
jgi:hypothetical protein